MFDPFSSQVRVFASVNISDITVMGVLPNDAIVILTQVVSPREKAQERYGEADSLVRVVEASSDHGSLSGLFIRGAYLNNRLARIQCVDSGTNLIPHGLPSQ